MGLSLDVTRQLYPVAEKLQPRCVHGLFLRCRIVVLSPGFLPPPKGRKGRKRGSLLFVRATLRESGSPRLHNAPTLPACLQAAGPTGRSSRDSLAASTPHRRASPAVRTVCLELTGERVTREAELRPPACLQTAGPGSASSRNSFPALSAAEPVQAPQSVQRVWL